MRGGGRRGAKLGGFYLDVRPQTREDPGRPSPAGLFSEPLNSEPPLSVLPDGASTCANAYLQTQAYGRFDLSLNGRSEAADDDIITGG